MKTRPAVLDIRDIVVEYPDGPKNKMHAVSGISFSILERETLGLVGESGCGKSSLARAVMMLPGPTSGRVYFLGRELTRTSPSRLRRMRPQFQMIFQHSAGALNPCRSVGDSISMPLKIMDKHISRCEKARRVENMILSVGLNPKTIDQLPSHFSGGQCQRIQIARALMSEPRLLICDEPVSSLDVSIQAQILNLLEDIRKQRGLAMLFISHDLAVVKNVSDRIAVMYMGKLCEIAPSERLYSTPFHPYTKALWGAIPSFVRLKETQKRHSDFNHFPFPTDLSSGCRFRTRCRRAEDICFEKEPDLRQIASNHQVACHFA